jgi:hypothetical protein
MKNPRHATVEDLLWMADLCCFYDEEVSRKNVLESFHTLFGTRPFLIWDNIGFVIFHIEKDILFLDGIAVVPKKLNSVSAGRIYYYIKSVAKVNNCKYIQGIVMEKNICSKRLLDRGKYDTIGYVVQREVT